jgi:hypothetical protein
MQRHFCDSRGRGRALPAAVFLHMNGRDRRIEN